MPDGSEHVISEIDPSESESRPTPDKVGDEIQQAPVTRRRLIRDIQQCLGGRTVVTYFTSFTMPVIIDDSDADMLESILRTADLSKGLCLVLNSPGGDALAAERIIRVCRVYSKDDFIVLVPKAAKSAATMIALGAEKILMSETAELGPIDPQVVWGKGDRRQYVPANAVISSYEELLEQATTLPEGGRIEPFLQQLDNYDASTVAQLRKLRDLSADIARQSLTNGMMKGKSQHDIGKCINMFTDWETTFTHGRAIFTSAMLECGLNVEVIPAKSSLADLAFELYLRTDFYVSRSASKTIEAAHHSLSTPPIGN